MTVAPEEALRASWVANAARWTDTVRSGAIASRALGTDAAIIRAVVARRPRRVLDLGCGEGWLVRALSDRGIEAVGTDASAPLIEAARSAGSGSFQLLTFQELASDPDRAGASFEAIAANFSLLDDDPGPLLAALRRLLAPGGALIIQTLHPLTAGPPYRDGWREETFAGFGPADEWRPMPWYFRTFGSWAACLASSGYSLAGIDEPLHPETLLPLSLLLVAEPR